MISSVARVVVEASGVVRGSVTVDVVVDVKVVIGVGAVAVVVVFAVTDFVLYVTVSMTPTQVTVAGQLAGDVFLLLEMASHRAGLGLRIAKAARREPALGLRFLAAAPGSVLSIGVNL